MTAPDLSHHHSPIGGLLELPTSQEAWCEHLLNDEQLAQYQRDGYVAGVRVLSDEQVDLLREQLTSLFDPEHAGRENWYEYHSNESGDANNVLFHALGAWRITAGFHDLLWSPAMTVAASQLLDGDVRFWHDQLFCKPAKHGGVVAWHQDYSYWTRTKPMAHLTCWIGLDDSTVDNGCLHYVPGSHKWDLLPITGLAGDMNAIRDVLDEQQWADFQSPVAIELKKGEAAFHHPLMVHGSYENRTERPRRAAVINMIRDGVVSDTEETLLGNDVKIPPGQPLDGQFFPLLLERNQTVQQ